MKALRIYFHYFLIYIRGKASYKLDFLVGIISNLLVGGFGLLFVLVLMDGKIINSLGEWSKEEVLFIYGYSLLAFSFFNCVSQNLFRFGDRYIIGGQFDRVLLRPLSSIAQILFESFNLDSIGTFILGLVVLINSANNLEMSFSFIDYVWLIFSVLSGSIILVSVFISLASLSFHFEDKLGVGAPVYGLINFGRYPINIFNKTVQFVLSFIIPFAFVAFYPATHFFTKEGFEIYCYLTPVVAVVSFSIALYFWEIGTRKYTSTGF